MIANLDLAKSVLDALKKLGVETICVCPGARNSPFIESLTTRIDFEKISFFDERAASFFAIGRMQVTEKPVVVITTSGTAAGELLPAVMEAYYSSLPLIVITADRPAHYRGTGAPQTAEQVGIYGIYVSRSYDLNSNADDSVQEFAVLEFNPEMPLHLNVCFDEPLPGKFDGAFVNIEFDVLKESKKNNVIEKTQKIIRFLEKYPNTLVLVSGLKSRESSAVKKFLLKSRLLFYAEGPSGLRECGDLRATQIYSADKILNRASLCDFPIDAVFRIGAVPTHRLWRDLESKTPVPVLSLSAKDFSGLPGAEIVHGDIAALLDIMPSDFVSKLGKNFHRFSQLKTEDSLRLATVEKLFSEEKWSEPSLIFSLSKSIPEFSSVYLGNSLPIREWDLAADFSEKSLQCRGTRGLNGIDGQISTFFGGLQKTQNWAIVGDLTALYDMQAPWVLPQLGNSGFKLVIVNNSGGKIFDRMFKKDEYLNTHDLNFEHWAKTWNLSYRKIDQKEGEMNFISPEQIFEIIPDPESTQRFWNQYEKI